MQKTRRELPAARPELFAGLGKALPVAAKFVGRFRLAQAAGSAASNVGARIAASLPTQRLRRRYQDMIR